MYVSKHLSVFKANPEALSQPPPEGPNSGYVVVKEFEDFTEDGTVESSCWGLVSYRPRVLDLPFPQNKVLTVHYSFGDNTYTENVLFVPVINLPLSANLTGTMWLLLPKESIKASIPMLGGTYDHLLLRELHSRRKAKNIRL